MKMPRNSLREGHSSRLVICILVTLLSGCASMRNGGAPEQSFDIDKDLAQLAAQFQPADNIRGFYANPILAERNRIVAGRLVLLDIRYLQFLRTLTVDKQQLDVATDILGLSLSLAGVSTAAIRAKTNLAAANAGVAGAKTTIDKYYYFEKTIPALITAMNAARKVVLTRILTGLQGDLAAYPFERALVDLDEYYLAGSLTGGINAIQADANDKEKAQDLILARLVPLSDTDIGRKAALTRAIGSLQPGDFDKAKAALAAIEGAAASPPSALSDAQVRLQRAVRSARATAEIDAVERAFRNANLM